MPATNIMHKRRVPEKAGQKNKKQHLCCATQPLPATNIMHKRRVPEKAGPRKEREFNAGLIWPFVLKAIKDLNV